MKLLKKHEKDIIHNAKKTLLVVIYLQIFSFERLVVAIDPERVAETIANLNDYSAAKIGTDAAKNAVASTSKSSSMLGALFDQFNQIIAVVFTINTLRSLAVDAGRAASAIKSYIKPSDEEVVSSLRMNDAYEYLSARKNFKDCLVKNVQGKKNVAERPEVCENLARMFALIGGNNEIEELTKIFKKVKAQHEKN